MEQIYRLNGTVPSDIEQEAFERGQFDATLDLLERRLPGQRLAVRSRLAQALKPKLRRKGATDKCQSSVGARLQALIPPARPCNHVRADTAL